MKTQEKNMLTETLSDKGFTSYTLKSNPRIVLNFPGKYSQEPKDLEKIAKEYSGDTKLMEYMLDKAYITHCANLAYQDYKKNTGIESKRARGVYGYLKRALRELGVKDDGDDED